MVCSQEIPERGQWLKFEMNLGDMRYSPKSNNVGIEIQIGRYSAGLYYQPRFYYGKPSEDMWEWLYNVGKKKHRKRRYWLFWVKD